MPKQTKTNRRSAALITGGANRIGRAIAMRLASMGYDIALHYNSSKTEAAKTQAKVEKMGRHCLTFTCNLANEKETIKLLPSVVKKFPGLTLLINNASIFEKSTLSKLNIRQFDADINVHLKSPFILTSQFAKLVKKGSIINLLDTNISKDKVSHFTYLLSKKALAHLTTMAAVDLAPHIRVNGISPGLVLAPKGKGENYLKLRSKNIPLKETGNPEQIADCVEFLLKNKYLTGQILFNDGGEHLI